MKYEHKIEINVPRKKVVELFNSSENLKKWQPGLISFDHISGTVGETGAKSKLFYKMDKREIEMIETITSQNFPEEFSATYEAKNVWNDVVNLFMQLDDNKTLWISKNEFRGTGVMKLMLWLMPSAFKKQSFQSMNDFKVFAEAEANKS